MAGGQTPPPPLSSHEEGENTYTNPLNPQHPRQPHDKVSTKQWNLLYDSNNPSASLMPAGVCSLTPPQEDEHHTIITNHPLKPSIGKQTNQIPLTEKSSAQTNGIFIGSHMVPFNQCFTPEVWDTRSSVVGLKLSDFASTSTRYQHISQDKPKVVFHKSDKAKLISGLKNTLIAKFSHGQPSVLMLRTFLSNRKLIGKFHVSFFDAKHIFIEFEHFVDFAKFWIKQKGIINGFPVRFFKWDELFDPTKESSIVPVWIHLPRLPFYLFEEGAILLIASALGRPLHIDANNLNKNKIGYATVCIELDILKVHPSDIWIQFGERTSDGKTDGSNDGFQQQIVYGFMPPFCSSCSHIGHQSVTCKRYSFGNDMKPAFVQHMNTQVEGSLLHSRSVLAVDESKDVSISEAREVIEEKELDGKLEPAAIRHAVSSTETMREICCCRDGVHDLECLYTSVAESARDIREASATPDIAPAAATLAQPAADSAAGSGSQASAAGLFAGGMPAAGEDGVARDCATQELVVREAAYGVYTAGGLMGCSIQGTFAVQTTPAGQSFSYNGRQFAGVMGAADVQDISLQEGEQNKGAQDVTGVELFDQKLLQYSCANSFEQSCRSANNQQSMVLQQPCNSTQQVLFQGTGEVEQKLVDEGLDNNCIRDTTQKIHNRSAVDGSLLGTPGNSHTASIPQKLSSAAAEFTPKWAVMVEELVEGQKLSAPVLVEKDTASYSKGEESLQQVYDRIKKMNRYNRTSSAQYVEQAEGCFKGIKQVEGMLVRAPTIGAVSDCAKVEARQCNDKKHAVLVEKKGGFIDYEKMKSILKRPSRRDRDDPLLKRKSTCDTNELGDFILPLEVDSEPSSPASRNSHFMDE